MINVLIGFFTATLITSLFTNRLFRLYLWYGINSLILGLIGILIGKIYNLNELVIMGIITIVIKFLIIPFALKKITFRFKISRDITPIIKIQYLTILVPVVLVFTYYLITPVLKTFQTHPNFVAISISSLFLSLLLIMEHKKMIAKIMGFLFIENSLFLLGIVATHGMPSLIELGVFFDLMMFILIINLLFKYQGE
ncbi:MAG: hydrogenase [Nautiliaceae bacterium]